MRNTLAFLLGSTVALTAFATPVRAQLLGTVGGGIFGVGDDFGSLGAAGRKKPSYPYELTTGLPIGVTCVKKPVDCRIQRRDLLSANFQEDDTSISGDASDFDISNDTINQSTGF